MKMKMISIPILGLLLLTSGVMAQSSRDGAWTHIQPEVLQRAERAAPKEAWISPDRYEAFSLDTAALKKSLAQAGREKSNEILQPSHIIELPNPDGTFTQFRVIESSVMAPKLAAKFPNIKTYRGQAVDDPLTTIRISLTPAGFSAQILSPSGTQYIDRLYRHDSKLYASYKRQNYSGKKLRQKRFQNALKNGTQPVFKCHGVLKKTTAKAEEPTTSRASRSSGTTLRVYRAAVAATGEYTAFHGGTVASAQAAIVLAMNRVTGVYEQELSVRLVLVANNDQLVFTNSATDPYDNFNSDQMVDQNPTTVNEKIGSANYDIGHVFSTGGGGMAGLGVVATDGKAEGVTGQDQPIGDAFWIDFVAHEMGHQFGANHTFNGNEGSCSGGNRNADTAYEPGSGSTIMAYAGICSTNNLQANSDPIFHSASFDEILTHLGTVQAFETTNTGNSVPVVEAGADYTIPAQTPFELTAVGNDADANDVLTYFWEERDLGVQNHPNDPDNGTGPIFRVWTPTVSPTQIFPRLEDLLNNTTSKGDQLPTTNRTLKFRVVVRDNRLGGGGVNQDNMEITVNNTAGPFRVTSPNASADSYTAGTTVTWDVAKTTDAPINTSHVDILLSTDGGLTYGTVLLSNTPNDGSEAISFPAIKTTQARIKVKAHGNIYFDISDYNFRTPDMQRREA